MDCYCGTHSRGLIGTTGAVVKSNSCGIIDRVGASERVCEILEQERASSKFTEPFWDLAKSGQWFHLAAVYDPIGRRVVQYANGDQLSSEEITDDFHIATLRIGPAEIGNWGQPFNAALTSIEIKKLYEQGKPLGY